MRLLFVAANRMEFTGVVAHMEHPRAAQVPVDWSRLAKMGGHDVLLAANGVGWKRAAEAVDAAADFRPDAVVSTGFCGALQEDLEIGDVVVGTGIAKKVGHALALWPALACLEIMIGKLMLAKAPEHAPPRTGLVCSLDHVAQTSEEKRLLRSSGACVVEMEAAGVAERAQALGIPFHCVKVVTDLAGETMANDFNSALRSDGHFDTMLILRRSFLNPFVRFPELIRLRNRCARAARALGEFFADCRF